MKASRETAQVNIETAFQIHRSTALIINTMIKIKLVNIKVAVRTDRNQISIQLVVQVVIATRVVVKRSTAVIHHQAVARIKIFRSEIVNILTRNAIALTHIARRPKKMIITRIKRNQRRGHDHDRRIQMTAIIDYPNRILHGIVAALIKRRQLKRPKRVVVVQQKNHNQLRHIQ